MPIVRIPYPNALPKVQADFVAQNNLIRTGFLQVNKSIWEDAANNIVQGAVFQVGGTVYYCNAATAIGGGASAYIKLTPSGDGSIVTPTYVADLTGVTWNSAYNGYYDVGGNAYIFDELVAIQAGEIATANTRLWKAINDLVIGSFTYSGNPIFSGLPLFSGGLRLTENSYTIRAKPMALPAWNMWNGGGGSNIANITHGLDITKIIGVTGSIISDAANLKYFFGYCQSATGNPHLWVSNCTATQIFFRQLSGSLFDNSDYDSVAASRGDVIIMYKE